MKQSQAVDWCDRLKALDAQFGTDRRSPLHHDNRCAIHTDNRTIDTGNRWGVAS